MLNQNSSMRCERDALGERLSPNRLCKLGFTPDEYREVKGK